MAFLSCRFSLQQSFVLLLISCLFGCASGGIQSPTGQPLPDVLAALESGQVRLSCDAACAVSWGTTRHQVKALHDNELWNHLAIEVSRVGYKVDLAYYYLGRAAEGLEYYDSASIYYNLALTNIYECDGIINTCDGFVFPRDLRNRLDHIEAIEYSKKLANKQKLADEERSEFKDKNIAESKLKEEQELYKKVRKIPARYVEENRDGYKKLSEMNPDNETYRKKYQYYRELAESRGKKKSTKIVSSSSYNGHEKPSSGDSGDKEALDELEAMGAFTKDSKTSSISVETGFWNTLDDQQKNAFCYKVQKTYPAYANSILDKYSGRKLAESNMHGQITAIR
jgi:tetratricopeptide (TPR) repeat protein